MRTRCDAEQKSGTFVRLMQGTFGKLRPASHSKLRECRENVAIVARVLRGRALRCAALSRKLRMPDPQDNDLGLSSSEALAAASGIQLPIAPHWPCDKPRTDSFSASSFFSIIKERTPDTMQRGGTIAFSRRPIHNYFWPPCFANQRF